jgi:hypothetical protein
MYNISLEEYLVCISQDIKILSNNQPNNVKYYKYIRATIQWKVDPNTICEIAAKQSALLILKRARKGEYESEWNERTCSMANGFAISHFAARREHLDILIWARQNKYPWDEATCSYAARSGHLEILQWARKNECPLDRYTCSMAMASPLAILQPWGGHLDILIWARQNGYPWDESTCSSAAGGHLHIIEWAHQNGCPCDKRRLLCMIPVGREDMIAYIQASSVQ